MWKKHTIAGILIIITMMILIRMFDGLLSGGVMTNRFFFKECCDCTVPDDWDIISDGKRFIIRHEERSLTQYIHYEPFGLTEGLCSSYVPLIFDTECRAKECLRRYLDGEEKKKWYKNFK